MSAINDIIALGKKLEAARSEAEQASSYAQAIRESEARLQDLRADEAFALAEADRVKREAAETLATARNQAALIVANAEAEAGAKTEAAQRALEEELQDTEREVVHLEACRDALQAEMAGLAIDRDRYQTQVDALKGELEALKARLG